MSERYKKLTSQELDVVRSALTPRVMRYVIRGNTVDLWRVRYFLRIASEGAAMGASPERIEQAMFEWVKNPNQETLGKSEIGLTVDAMGYNEAAKDAGLSAQDLLQMNAQVDLLGGNATAVMSNPATFRTIKSMGKTRGLDEVYKNVIQTGFGIPDEALQGRNSKALLGRIADVQAQGFDQFLGSGEFWRDIKALEQGRLKQSDFRERWQQRASGGDDRERQERQTTKQRATETSRRQRDAEVNRENKGKPEKKIKKEIRLDPIVVKGSLRHPVRDEVVVYVDEAKTRPWLVRRTYHDGSSDILVADGKGNLSQCYEEYELLVPQNRATPVVRLHRMGCYSVPALGSVQRTPGPIRSK